MSRSLQQFGWTEELEDAFRPYAEDHIAGRIAVEHRGAYVAYTTDDELRCEIAGALRYRARDRTDFPAVGDWVALRRREWFGGLPRQKGEASTTIDAILPRSSAFVRKDPGFKTSGQVLAANVDLVWVVSSLTRELSARRVERYLAVAWESGAQPMVVLTKADLEGADLKRVAEVERVSVGAPIVVTSAVTGEGIDELRVALAGSRTAALLGSSGVGKSTLVNTLLGEERLATLDTRSDDVGRHTTTRRELLCVPSGGMVIDTPGLRELLVWDDEPAAGFADIDDIISRCRFSDCSHVGEPGCAVRGAIASGELDAGRWRSYGKMQRELAYVDQRKKGKAELDVKRNKRAIRDRDIDREERGAPR